MEQGLNDFIRNANVNSAKTFLDHFNVIEGEMLFRHANGVSILVLLGERSLKLNRGYGLVRSDFFFTHEVPEDIADPSSVVHLTARELRVDETLIWELLDEGRYVFASQRMHWSGLNSWGEAVSRKSANIAAYAGEDLSELRFWVKFRSPNDFDRLTLAARHSGAAGCVC